MNNLKWSQKAPYEDDPFSWETDVRKMSMVQHDRIMSAVIAYKDGEISGETFLKVIDIEEWPDE